MFGLSVFSGVNEYADSSKDELGMKDAASGVDA